MGQVNLVIDEIAQHAIDPQEHFEVPGVPWFRSAPA